MVCFSHTLFFSVKWRPKVEGEIKRERKSNKIVPKILGHFLDCNRKKCVDFTFKLFDKVVPECKIEFLGDILGEFKIHVNIFF